MAKKWKYKVRATAPIIAEMNRYENSETLLSIKVQSAPAWVTDVREKRHFETFDATIESGSAPVVERWNSFGVQVEILEEGKKK